MLELLVVFTLLWQPAPAYPIRVLSVLDGDTLVVDINFGYRKLRAEEVIRLEGFDAWETSKARHTLKLTKEQWVEEIRKGKLAKKDLEELLTKSKILTLQLAPGSTYDRLIGKIKADGVDLGEYLTKRGHARK